MMSAKAWVSIVDGARTLLPLAVTAFSLVVGAAVLAQSEDFEPPPLRLPTFRRAEPV